MGGFLLGVVCRTDLDLTLLLLTTSTLGEEVVLRLDLVLVEAMGVLGEVFFTVDFFWGDTLFP